MVSTDKKALEDIVKTLEDYDRIFLVGCGDCATLLQTGGEFEVQEMAQALAEQGKQVTGWVVPDVTCKVLDVKKLLRQHQEEVDAAEAILVLACGSGVQAVAEVSDKPVYPALDTLGIVDQFRLGQFYEWCSACGECVVGDYGGICPLTRCPKGQVNGPCGGVNDGKCEVDPDKDCVWTVIYKRMEERDGVPEALTTGLRPPRDYQKSIHPRQRVFEPRRG